MTIDRSRIAATASPVIGLIAGAMCWAMLDPAQVAAATPSLPIYLHVEPQRALGEPFQKRMSRRVANLLEHEFGHAVQWLDPVEQLQSQLTSQGLESLTVEQCRDIGFDDNPQTLVLTVSLDGGTYRLAVTSHHRDFNDIAPIESLSIVQRELVADNLARLARNAWRPTGRLVKSDKGKLLLTAAFEGQSVLVRSGTLFGLEPGTPLEVVRLSRKAGNLRRRFWSLDLLVIKTASASAITARPACPRARLSSFFGFLGRTGIQYVARVVRPRPGPMTIEVRLKPGGRPREHCAVYVSDEIPEPGIPDRTPDGFTDETGRFTIVTSEPRLKYVLVALGGRYQVQAAAAGDRRGPLKFSIPRHGPQGRWNRDHQRVVVRINDARLRLNHLVGQARRLTVEKRLEQLAGIIVDLEHRPDFNRPRLELRRLRDRAQDDQLPDLEQEAGTTLAALDQLHADRVRETELVRSNRRSLLRARLQQQVKTAFEQYRWRQAIDTLDELIALDPDNAKAARLRRRLSDGLTPNSSEHATARRTVARLIKADSGTELLSVWPQLSQGLRVLIRNNDGMTFYELKAHRDPIEQLASAEVKRVLARVKSLDPCDDEDEDEYQRLKVLADSIIMMQQELHELNEKAATLAAGFVEDLDN